jgi:hypothetical protein
MPALFTRISQAPACSIRGIVHKNIAGPCLFDQGTALVTLRHVGPDIADRNTVPPGHVGGQRMIFCRVGERIKHHMRPGPGQRFGDAQTYAGG